MIYLKFMEIYFNLILTNQILSLIETFYLFVISTRNILHLDRLQDLPNGLTLIKSLVLISLNED